MLNGNRLAFAIEIHSKSYQFLRWIGVAIEEGRLPIGRATQHADTPEAAIDWISKNRLLLPQELRPDPHEVREFASFFWTYVIASFDVVPNPGTLLKHGLCGCMCPLCARIFNAPHLRPKALTRLDKRRAIEMMEERVVQLATEERLNTSRERCAALVCDPAMRRSAAYSAYGCSLIDRLSGNAEGPAILALWREIAWTRMGSPIQGFTLRSEDFAGAEMELIQRLSTMA